MTDRLLTSIAERLGETATRPREQLARLLTLKSSTELEAVLTEAEQIAARHGLLTEDGSRPRTLGGIFFYLVRRTLSWRERAFVFGLPPDQLPMPKNWRNRKHLYADLTTAGTVRSLRATLTGNPEKVVVMGQLVLCLFKVMPSPKGLEKGIEPPNRMTSITMYIALKHWRVVAEHVAGGGLLSIEGILAYDQGLEGVSLYARKVTASAKVKTALTVSLLTTLGTVITKKDQVLSRVVYQPPTGNLPKELPPVPTTATPIMLYVGRTAWQHLGKYTEETPLIIEGIGYSDPYFAGLTVSARAVTVPVSRSAADHLDR